MESDIILENDQVKINGSRTEISSDNYRLDIGNDGVKVHGALIEFVDQDFTVRSGGTMRLGDKKTKSGKASFRVISEKGNSVMHSIYIQTPTVHTEDINTKTLTIGLSPTDNPKPGKIEFINKQGEVCITIDGNSEDIILQSIGSLKDKIRELERKIAQLENPRILRRQ